MTADQVRAALEEDGRSNAAAAGTTVHPDAVVTRARLIAQRGGYSAREIRMHLLDEGHDVPSETIKSWLQFKSRIDATAMTQPTQVGAK